MQIYNTLSRSKQLLQPLSPPSLRMYVCGMTVYDLCHVGHARVLIVFDMVARYLRYSGYQLTYVRNITDIDDKIIARSNEQQEDWQSLTQRFIVAMHDDAAALGVLPADQEPRATEYMPEILDLNQRLIAKRHAYVSASGDVYFSVRSFATYGRLGGRDIEELQVGARVEPGDQKKDPLDFALWKAAKPAEPSWASPWGPGRPGWHIECSAMSSACLGEQLDIHGGGGDLVFPHHENEIAQSESVSGKPLAGTWMHVGFVQVDEVKMSKSLGNFFTIREVLRQYRPEVLRYFILASHYRSPLNYSQENLEHARTALERFYQTLQAVQAVAAKATSAPTEMNGPEIDPWILRFRAVMDDDFNTPEALSVLFELTREINRLLNDGECAAAQQLAGGLLALAALLGLLQDSCTEFLQSGGRACHSELTVTEIEKRIQDRQQAKQAKDFASADQIRQDLLVHGVVLEDSRQGTRWRRG